MSSQKWLSQQQEGGVPGPGVGGGLLGGMWEGSGAGARAHIHVHASLFIFQQEEAGRARLPPPTPLGQTEDWASEETLWSNSENGTKPHRAPGRGGAVRSRRGTHTSWRETEAEADVDRHPRRRPLRPRLSEGPLGGCAEPRHCPRRLPPPPSLPLRPDGEGSSHVLPSQGMTVKGPDCQMNKLRRVPLTMGSHRMSLRFCFVFEARLTPPWSFHHSPEYLSPLLLDSELPEDRGQPQRLTVLDT